MKRLMICILALWPMAAPAQDSLTLAVPEAVSRTGFIGYLLPRFTLKHRIRVAPVGPDAEARMTLGETGTPVFTGAGRTWHLATDESDAAQTFADWLTSPVGRNTIASFDVDGTTPFAPPQIIEAAAQPMKFDGDAAEGARLSLALCGRCHVVGAVNRMKGMGATPSFALLRAMPDWARRFAEFYRLNPHPSFTQVPGKTAPFDPARPPMIAPLEISAPQIDAIRAFVAGMAPADLGAPLQRQ